jgi:hypothetical protein
LVVDPHNDFLAAIGEADELDRGVIGQVDQTASDKEKHCQNDQDDPHSRRIRRWGVMWSKVGVIPKIERFRHAMIVTSVPSLEIGRRTLRQVYRPLSGIATNCEFRGVMRSEDWYGDGKG